MSAPSAIGCLVVGESPIESGGPCVDVQVGVPPQVSYPSAIGCLAIGLSPIESGGPCVEVSDGMLCEVIPSYLYWQYRDDDNLQAFVDAYNQLAQAYISWFCALNLPAYTQDPIVAGLLDWVGAGLYGLDRPVLGAGQEYLRGPYDTWRFNELGYNERRRSGTFTSQRASDDLYRRALTWHFYKGDGRQFTITWLKRRVARFLIGADGRDPGVDQTYRVSVSIGLDRQINITLLRYMARRRRSAAYDTWRFNERTYDEIDLAITDLGPQLDAATQFKQMVEQGMLELPFQYTYVVTVQ